MAENVITVDWGKAPPAQSGGSMTHIPQGDYIIEVASVERGTANSGRKKATINYYVIGGEYTGSTLRDIFTFPKDANDKIFPLQRLHAALVAFGWPIMTGKQQVNLDDLIGRRCKAHVIDNEMEASGEYEARTVSKIERYSPLPQTNTNGNGTTAVAAPKAAKKAAEEVDDNDEPEPMSASVLDEDEDPFGM